MSGIELELPAKFNVSSTETEIITLTFSNDGENNVELDAGSQEDAVKESSLRLKSDDLNISEKITVRLEDSNGQETSLMLSGLNDYSLTIKFDSDYFIITEVLSNIESNHYDLGDVHKVLKRENAEQEVDLSDFLTILSYDKDGNLILPTLGEEELVIETEQSKSSANIGIAVLKLIVSLVGLVIVGLGGYHFYGYYEHTRKLKEESKRIY